MGAPRTTVVDHLENSDTGLHIRFTSPHAVGKDRQPIDAVLRHVRPVGRSYMLKIEFLTTAAIPLADSMLTTEHGPFPSGWPIEVVGDAPPVSTGASAPTGLVGRLDPAMLDRLRDISKQAN